MYTLADMVPKEDLANLKAEMAKNPLKNTYWNQKIHKKNKKLMERVERRSPGFQAKVLLCVKDETLSQSDALKILTAVMMDQRLIDEGKQKENQAMVPNLILGSYLSKSSKACQKSKESDSSKPAENSKSTGKKSKSV